MELKSGGRPRVYPAVFDKSGRVSMPAELRAVLGVKGRARVHWVRDEHGIRIETPEDALRRLQQYCMSLAPPERVLSEELIVERRAEALRE